MPIRFRHRLARTGLLLAALLQLLGGGVLAAAHAEEPRPDAVAVDGQDGERDPRSPAPHDGRHCALCQAIGASALPEPAVAGAHAEAREPLAAGSRHASVPARPVLRAPARAPPPAA